MVTRFRKRNRATVRFATSSHDVSGEESAVSGKETHDEIGGGTVMSSFQWLWASAMPPEKRNFENAPVETASALTRGACSRAIDGVVAEVQPKVSCADGFRFGMTHWIDDAETAVSATGLPYSPTHTAARAIARALACDLAYDVSTELIRRHLTRWVNPS